MERKKKAKREGERAPMFNYQKNASRMEASDKEWHIELIEVVKKGDQWSIGSLNWIV